MKKFASAMFAATLFAFSTGLIGAQTSSTLGKPIAPQQLKPLSNAPITLHVNDDSKKIYLAIGKLAGINVLFDSDYISKPVQVDLTNASLSDALRIVDEVGGAFYKPLTQDTIFVAQNTRAKHTTLDELEVRTFHLKNSTQASDANEINTALRNLLPPDAKIYLVPSENVIIVQCTPELMELAQKVLNDLDRPKKTYRLTYTITQMDGGKRVGTQHFSMVVVSGQQTKMKQGSKVPIITGSYNATATTGDHPAPAGVQTQVTYLDVGMNFETTLQAMGEGAILKSSVEQSSLAPEVSGVGPQDPILRSNTLTGEAILTAGKPLMLGSLDILGSTAHLDVEVVMEPLP